MPKGKGSVEKRAAVRKVLTKRVAQDAQLPRDPANPADTLETLGGLRPAGFTPTPKGKRSMPKGRGRK